MNTPPTRESFGQRREIFEGEEKIMIPMSNAYIATYHPAGKPG
jgi:hypothetical protein